MGLGDTEFDCAITIALTMVDNKTARQSGRTATPWQLF
jgi:hypothetical protein